jgi:arsenate reductase
MSEAEALAALVADGKLVKRPLVLGDDFALVGFDEKAYRDRFR